MFKNLSATFLLTFMIGNSSSFAAPAKKATPSPLKSTELIEFTGVADLKMLDFAKTENYVGLITRPNEQGDLRLIDVYSFKDIKTTSVDKSVCEKMLAGIFGPLNKISLKVKSLEIYASHTGKTCDALIVDEDKEAKIPHRRVLAGFINAQPRALLLKLSAAPNKPIRTKAELEETQTDLRHFWATLR